MDRFNYFFAVLFSIVAVFFVSATAVNAGPSLPDLKIESLTIDPANYNVKVLIGNIGDAPLQLPGTNSTVYLLCFNSSGVSFECPDRVKFFRALPNVPDFLEPGAQLEVIFSPRSDEVAKVTAGMFIKDQFNNTIKEKSTVNNFISSTPIPRKPDLVFESISLTNQDFAYAVKNNGGGERAQAGVELQWLRQDKTVIGNSFQQIIETPATSGRASFNYRNDGYGSDISKFLWYDTPRDAAILRVTLNYSNIILESNTANNTAEVNRLFPDIKLDSLTFDPDTGKPKVIISNIGRGTAAFTGTTDPCADIYIGGRDNSDRLKQDTIKCLAGAVWGKSSLLPGESMAFLVDFIPEPTIKNIFGVLNYSNLINEGEANKYQNNLISDVPVAWPDLAPVSATLDTVGRYPIITFKNQGSVKASSGGRGNTINFVWLNSAGQVSDGYSQTLLPGLDVSAGQTYTIDFSAFAQNYARYVLPKSDSVKIRVKVDNSNRIYEGEGGENNNTSDFDLPLPDYIIDSVSFTDKLEFTIRNIGDSSPIPVAVRFQWLKQDGTLTGEPTVSRDVVLPSTNEQKVTYINDGGPIGKFFWTEAPQDARRLKLTITFTDREAPPESNIQNNNADVERPLPDLKIDSITFDPQTNAPKVIISNIGSATANFTGVNVLSDIVFGCKDFNGRYLQSTNGTCSDIIRLNRIKDSLATSESMDVILNPLSNNVAKFQAAVRYAGPDKDSPAGGAAAGNNRSDWVDVPLPDFTIANPVLTKDGLTYTIRNIGSLYAGYFRTYARWLKADKTPIGRMDQPLLGQAMSLPASNELNLNHTNSRSAIWYSPYLWEDIPADAKYLRLTVYGSDQALVEINSDNNSAELERPLPDYTIVDASITGDELKYTIRNISTSDTSQSASAIRAQWLKEDKTNIGPSYSMSPWFSTDEAGVTTFRRPTDDSEAARFFWTDIPSAARYLKLTATPSYLGGGPIPEITTGNNSFEIERPLPDFAFDSSSSFTGQRLEYVIKNTGSAVNKDRVMVVAQWLTQDGIPVGDSRPLGGFNLASTNIGRTALERGNISTNDEDFFWSDVHQTAQRLRLTLFFYPDSSSPNTGAESNVDNNSITFDRPAPDLPDLVVDSVTFDPTLRYPIITIKNQGNAPAKKRSVNIPDAHYLWLNAESEQIGDYLGFWNLDEIIELAPGQSLLAGPREGYESLTVDYLPPSGAVKVRVLLDEMKLITESNEDNNVMETDVPEADADELDYPIAELGNCQNREDCRVYCEQPENAEACAEFGVKYGLLTEEEAKALKDMSKIVKGPGDCKNKEECAIVCEKPENTDACLDFAEQNNWISADDLSKARKVADVLKTGGTTPGGCSTPGSCKIYCSDNSNAVECVEFGKSAGLLTAEEAEEAEKVAPLMQSGAMPGGKTNREELEAYCENNREECDKFFEQVGVKKEGEKPEGEGPKDGEPKDGESKNGEPKDETKISSIFNKDGAEDGEAGPGGCKTKAECDAYCDSHPGECDEQVKQAGGEVKEATAICSTREECEAFCDDPANKEAESCKDGTIIIKEEPPESLGPTEGPGEDPLEKLRSDIQEVISQSQSQDCVKQILGEEVFTKFVIEGGIPEKAISREELQPCFDEAKQAVEQQEMIKMQKKPDDPDMGSPPQ